MHFNLKNKGIDYIDDLECLNKDKKIIIRTHGILKSDEELLKEQDIHYVDATCNLVLFKDKNINDILREKLFNKE